MRAHYLDPAAAWGWKFDRGVGATADAEMSSGRSGRRRPRPGRRARGPAAPSGHERHGVGVHQRAHHLGRSVTWVEGASDVGVPGLVGARPALFGRCSHTQGEVAGVADRAAEPGDHRRRRTGSLGELGDRQPQRQGRVLEQERADLGHTLGHPCKSTADPAAGAVAFQRRGPTALQEQSLKILISDATGWEKLFPCCGPGHHQLDDTNR